MSAQSRIESLERRHADLDRKILKHYQAPRPDFDTIHRLKSEKLRAKDALETMKRLVH